MRVLGRHQRAARGARHREIARATRRVRGVRETVDGGGRGLDLRRVAGGERNEHRGREGAAREVTLDLAARRLLTIDATLDLPDHTEVGFRDLRGVTSEPVARILFLPDGSASGGTVELLADDLRIVIAVDWITGRVRTRDR